MKTVFKYPLTDKAIPIPRGAIVRHVALQDDRICLWVEVDTDREPEAHTFKVYGTGHQMPQINGVYSIYLGTVHTKFGEVYHVYEQV